MDLCSNSAALSVYHDYHDRSALYQVALIEKTKELLATPIFYPFDEGNYLFALEESDMRPVVGFNRVGSYYEGGKLEAQIVVDYWTFKARRKAEEILEDECRICFGGGCPICVDEERN